MNNNIKAFGCMTMNLAAATGVKQAIQTVETATKTLEQQCKLQENMAMEMGGIGKDAGNGLISFQFNEQINSANCTKEAIQDEAYGAIASAVVGTVGFGASCGTFGFAGENSNLEDQLKTAKSFKDDLNPKVPGNEASVTINSEDKEVENQIDKWMGSATKDPDCSGYDKKNPVHINSIQKLKGDVSKKTIVNQNIDKHISNIQDRISSNKTQKQNTYVNLINQAAQAGEGYASAGGKLGQASKQAESQEFSASASVVQTAEETTKAQMQASQQAASTFQNEIASILQGIAFPA